jgi:glycosyltransferase involved in cell wall biosynthesis
MSLSSVYFISGCEAGTTFDYRVLQKQEQLSQRGVCSLARQGLNNPERLFREMTSHDILYLYRVAYNSLIDMLINQAQRQGIPVVFDVDDLVFEPDLVHHIDPVSAMEHEEAASYYEGVWRYRRTLMLSDAIITSTEYLADRVRALGKRAFVHRNGLSKWMITEALTLIQSQSVRSSHKKVILGYGSGTATHREDISEIAKALAEILSRHSNVELHIVGALHHNEPCFLPRKLKPYGKRIRYQPSVAWEDWLKLQSKFDVNLAPLEANNPYCDAKSEIKYVEAAIVSVPTIASCTDAFEFAIHDGSTGFLAEGTDEWVAKLEKLVTDEALRRRMGKAARSDVLNRYTPDVLGGQLINTLTSIKKQYKSLSESVSDSDLDSSPLVMNWIFPEPIPGSGGHRDIIRMINLLASFGHHINAYVVPRRQLWNKSDQEIREFIHRHFGCLNGALFKWNDGLLDKSDAIILTHWTTAYLVGDDWKMSKVLYFVQDWEPFFFPMGTSYLRAEQTYKMGFFCITLGRWLTKRLRDWYDAEADYFDLAVDHSVYYPRPVEKVDHPRICFYARPSTPRRLFPIGIEALRLIHQRRPDVEIILYGTEDADLRRHAIPFPYTNYGILTEDQLAKLFSACDVGIVLSSTNCSLVPPEMMACKCAVVDLNRETVMGVLEHNVNALLAEPTPSEISKAVLRLLEDGSLRQRLVETAYRRIQERSWRKSARKVEDILYRKLSSIPRSCSSHHSTLSSNLPALNALPEDQQRHLTAIHKARRRLLTRGKAYLKSCGRGLLNIGQDLALNGAPVQTLGELTKRQRIGQHFTAWRDGLCRVDVLVDTYNKCNTRDIVFRLKEHPGAESDIATARLNASLLTNREYVSFIFPPQHNSGGKSYYFSVESPGSLPGDAITLWAYRDAVVPGVELKRNGEVIDGHLIFGLFYQDEQLGVVGERPLLHNWGRQTTFWRRLQKAWQVFIKEGIEGLWCEVISYWKWKTGRGD